MSPKNHIDKTEKIELEKLEHKPKKVTSSRPLLWTLLVGSTIISAYLSALVFGGSVPSWEKDIFFAINQSEPAGFIELLARILSDIVWLGVFIVAGLLLWKRFFWAAYRIAVPSTLTFGVIYVIEHIVQRGRPDDLYGSEVIMRASQDGYGFPSGHAGTISAILLALWPVLNWPLRFVSIGLISGVLWSRIFLGVHMPLDVVAGCSIALIIACGLSLLPQVLRKKFKLV